MWILCEQTKQGLSNKVRLGSHDIFSCVFWCVKRRCKKMHLKCQIIVYKTMQQWGTCCIFYVNYVRIFHMYSVQKTRRELGCGFPLLDGAYTRHKPLWHPCKSKKWNAAVIQGCPTDFSCVLHAALLRHVNPALWGNCASWMTGHCLPSLVVIFHIT